MIDFAKTIWDVGKGVFGIRGELQKARRGRRDRLANYFSELAQPVESVSASLRTNQYPRGSCAQLLTLARLMSQTVKGLVEPDEARKFREKLMRVWEIEQLFGEPQGQPKGKVNKRVAELDEAEGFFRATAAHLRVV